MRAYFLAAFMVAGLAVPALAQNQPAAAFGNGNHANGNSYEPTPNEVLPREKRDGVLPQAAQQQQTNQQLWRMDANLLKSEGLSTRSVPDTGAPARQ